MDKINNYTGSPYYYDEWIERQKKASKVKKANKEEFGSFSSELKAIWDNKCNTCYHRYVCKFKNKGTCPTPNSYFESKEHDKAVMEEALDKVLKRLTNIDSCGWAMFSLCLIKEIVEDVKKGR